MKFYEAFNYYLDKSKKSKTFVARRIGVELPYIVLISKPGSRPPTLMRVEKIADALGLTESEKESLLKLAYEERVIEKDTVSFKKYVESVFGKVIVDEEDSSPLLSWNVLYKHGLSPEVTKQHHGKNKEVNTMRVQLGDSDNEPDFEAGDILHIGAASELEDGKFFIFRDKKKKSLILRRIKKLGDQIYLRTTSLKIEDLYDPKRFEVVAKVLKHSRERNLA